MVDFQQPQPNKRSFHFSFIIFFPVNLALLSPLSLSLPQWVSLSTKTSSQFDGSAKFSFTLSLSISTLPFHFSLLPSPPFLFFLVKLPSPPYSSSSSLILTFSDTLLLFRYSVFLSLCAEFPATPVTLQSRSELNRTISKPHFTIHWWRKHSNLRAPRTQRRWWLAWSVLIIIMICFVLHQLAFRPLYS